VARIVVDKERNALSAYDKDGRLLAHYPATVGSASRPAPTGSFEVTKVVRNPVYTFNPKDKFAGVHTDQPFNIAPGPNNPVGTVWIEINKDGYGIHGTPEPEDIGKTASHGCVRLTNWDAEDLAKGVEKRIPAEFK
jgi:lipoprotein-anchoring transpeptidase ErfK/SrfK